MSYKSFGATNNVTDNLIDVGGGNPFRETSALNPDDLTLDSPVGGGFSSSTTVPALSGRIGASEQTSTGNTTTNSERATFDTLDEPVSVTIMRDLSNVWQKLKQVLLPRQEQNKNILRDWDLWGPLLLCLALAIRLGVTAPEEQSAIVFTGVFVIVWCGAAVVTLNSKLLGGRISFFQSVCVLGYCIFPLVLASILSLFLPSIVLRAIFVGIAFVWSTYASIGFLADTGLQQRRILAIYPIFLFYFGLSWSILISRSLFG